MNLLDLLAKITLDTDEYEQGLDEAKDKSSQLGEALKNGLVKGAKLAAAALRTATAAIGALTKAALDQYGDYEQLVGGVETLFKDSAGKVKEYAGLYAEKQKLASDTATAELSGFLRETEKKIAEGNRQLKQLNDEYGPKIGLSLMDGMALGIKQGAGGLRQAMAQTMQGVYQAAMQAMNRLAGGMGLQTSVGGIKAGIVGQDILPSQGLTQGVVEFGQSALGASSASLVNSLAGAAGKAADASLTVNLNMDGRKLASALLDPLAKFAKANGTEIINAT